jgi:hypothetical protein
LLHKEGDSSTIQLETRKSRLNNKRGKEKIVKKKFAISERKLTRKGRLYGE